jgi:hypothetical protein
MQRLNAELNPELLWQKHHSTKTKQINKIELYLRKKLVKSGAQLCVVLKLGNFGQHIRNTWEVLECGAGEGWRSQLDRSCEK